MKLLICGAGRIARELVRQLGDDWRITLIDKSGEELSRTAALSPDIQDILAEDASSSVVLEKAGVGTFDHVIAMTGNDQVNRAVALMAREAGVPHVCAMLSGMEPVEDLRIAGIHVLQSTKLLFGDLYHYLQNPLVLVSPLHLGPASVMELKASEHKNVVGKRVGSLRRRRSRLVGLIRGGKLVFPAPEAKIREDDRLVLMGDPDVFQSVCGMLECDNPSFPLTYGAGMLIAPQKNPRNEALALLSEAQYLAQNSQVKSITLLNPAQGEGYEKNLHDWPQNISLDIRAGTEDMADSVREACKSGNFGLIMIPPLEESMFSFFSRPAYVGLADDIVRPLLVARGTAPYNRILVPFHATPMSELALEIGVDLARQLDAEVFAATVEEPDFITGRDEVARMETVRRRLNELSHIYKTRIGTVDRKGNPVKELVSVSRDYDLMIVGVTNRTRSLFSPNVGDHLAREAQCSTLVVTL